MARYLFTFTLIALAALSRLLPHPLNFAPITALALFGAVYLDKKHAFIVPVAAVLISDYFLGFYPGMVWVYASFIAAHNAKLYLFVAPRRMCLRQATRATKIYRTYNFEG